MAQQNSESLANERQYILVRLDSPLVSNAYTVRLGISPKFLYWQLQKSIYTLGCRIILWSPVYPWDFRVLGESSYPLLCAQISVSCCFGLDGSPGHLWWDSVHFSTITQGLGQLWTPKTLWGNCVLWGCFSQPDALSDPVFCCLLCFAHFRQIFQLSGPTLSLLHAAPCIQ